MDLVEKALQSEAKDRSRKDYTREEVDLAVAWVNGKVTMSQACDAMNKTRNMYACMSSMLLYGRRRGWITVSENEA